MKGFHTLKHNYLYGDKASWFSKIGICILINNPNKKDENANYNRQKELQTLK